MNSHLLQIIQTGIVIAVLVFAHFITRHGVKSVLKKFHFSLQRRRLTLKAINLILSIMAVIFISAIWGVHQTDLVVFISSALAILGIAFVAQWSILSNITAGLVLFFTHPLKLGDHIKVIEKDFVIEGIIDDITYFFVHIKTTDKERITISNSLIMQKAISIVQPQPSPKVSKVRV